eukprot:1161442-Pelagomonas_calceolata.AAC.7
MSALGSSSESVHHKSRVSEPLHIFNFAGHPKGRQAQPLGGVQITLPVVQRDSSVVAGELHCLFHICPSALP